MAQKKRTRKEKKVEVISTHLGLDFKINERYALTDKQKQLISLAQRDDTKIVVCDGPAGTSKTYISVYIALNMLKQKRIDQILYIRSIVESASKKLGSLPGEVDEKFKPWSIPLLEKCDEFIGMSMTNSLIDGEFIHCVPVNYLRGSTFRNSVVIVDEAQNLEMSEIITILTRFGHNCKMFVIGDSLQSDIQKTCFKRMCEVFKGEDSKQQGIHCFAFNNEDIVRDELLKFIVKKMPELKM